MKPFNVVQWELPEDDKRLTMMSEMSVQHTGGDVGEMIDACAQPMVNFMGIMSGEELDGLSFQRHTVYEHDPALMDQANDINQYEFVKSYLLQNFDIFLPYWTSGKLKPKMLATNGYNPNDPTTCWDGKEEQFYAWVASLVNGMPTSKGHTTRKGLRSALDLVRGALAFQIRKEERTVEANETLSIPQRNGLRAAKMEIVRTECIPSLLASAMHLTGTVLDAEECHGAVGDNVAFFMHKHHPYANASGIHSLLDYFGNTMDCLLHCVNSETLDEEENVVANAKANSVLEANLAFMKCARKSLDQMITFTEEEYITKRKSYSIHFAFV